ncbi:MAG: hypothetical protein K8F24_12620 [Bacteroidales bacterium]|nr:hypothetical protein [Bacteroidales bacterium]
MKQKLLAFEFKILGWVLIFAAIILTLFYAFSNLRISLPVFAIYSSFLETKLFTVFTTNFIEELIMLSYLGGFFLVAFSKSRHEQSKDSKLRSIALFKAMIYNTMFLVFCILFIYGNGFMFVLLINLFSTFVFYLLFFQWLKYKKKREQEL